MFVLNNKTTNSKQNNIMSKEEVNNIIMSIIYILKREKDKSCTKFDVEYLKNMKEKLIKKLNEELETE
jgi:hypothetical protein